MIVYGGRGNGKTKRAVEYSAEHNIRILVTDDNRRSNVMQTAKYLGLKIPTPVTIEEIINGKYRREKNIVVDDVEDVIKSITKASGVDMITTSENILNI